MHTEAIAFLATKTAQAVARNFTQSKAESLFPQDPERTFRAARRCYMERAYSSSEACRRTKWWRELGGRFEMMSGTVSDLFEILKIRHPLELSCEIMAREGVTLWAEIRINVGDRVYAKDA